MSHYPTLGEPGFERAFSKHGFGSRAPREAASPEAPGRDTSGWEAAAWEARDWRTRGWHERGQHEEERLPLSVAVPIIALSSLGLWIVLWRVAATLIG